eukprot:scaffold7400_cov100-Isochrysis_galbana.AAC.3
MDRGHMLPAGSEGIRWVSRKRERPWRHAERHVLATSPLSSSRWRCTAPRARLARSCGQTPERRYAPPGRGAGGGGRAGRGECADCGIDGLAARPPVPPAGGAHSAGQQWTARCHAWRVDSAAAGSGVRLRTACSPLLHSSLFLLSFLIPRNDPICSPLHPAPRVLWRRRAGRRHLGVLLDQTLILQHTDHAARCEVRHPTAVLVAQPRGQRLLAGAVDHLQQSRPTVHPASLLLALRLQTRHVPMAVARVAVAGFAAGRPEAGVRGLRLVAGRREDAQNPPAQPADATAPGGGGCPDLGVVPDDPGRRSLGLARASRGDEGAARTRPATGCSHRRRPAAAAVRQPRWAPTGAQSFPGRRHRSGQCGGRSTQSGRPAPSRRFPAAGADRPRPRTSQSAGAYAAPLPHCKISASRQSQAAGPAPTAGGWASRQSPGTQNTVELPPGSAAAPARGANTRQPVQLGHVEFARPLGGDDAVHVEEHHFDTHRVTTARARPPVGRAVLAVTRLAPGGGTRIRQPGSRDNRATKIGRAVCN